MAHLADDPGRREALTVPSRPELLLRILVGPFAFLAVQIAPLTGLAPEAYLALGSYAWVLAWWAATPIPWAVTGFLPLVLFPLCDVMTFREVSALYGQRVHPRARGGDWANGDGYPHYLGASLRGLAMCRLHGELRCASSMSCVVHVALPCVEASYS